MEDLTLLRLLRAVHGGAHDEPDVVLPLVDEPDGDDDVDDGDVELDDDDDDPAPERISSFFARMAELAEDPDQPGEADLALQRRPAAAPTPGEADLATTTSSFQRPAARGTLRLRSLASVLW